MKKRFYIKFIEKHWLVISFIAAGLLLFSFFPRGGKFKYEYQKGKPWLHEVLIAPFDFPIYKTDEDLAKEKDSIVRNFPAYFNYNPRIWPEKRELLAKKLPTLWNDFANNYPSQIPAGIREKTEQKVLDLLEMVYQHGILELPDENSAFSKESPTLNIVKGNIAQEVDRSNVFTPKQAYEYIQHELENFNDEIVFSSGVNLMPYFQTLRLNQYLVPNLFYDASTTEKTRQSALDNISLTEGMVMAGERIIFTGDIVNNRSYKILESLKKEYEERMGFSPSYLTVMLGQLIIVTFCLILLYVYFRKNFPHLLYSPNATVFILLIIVLFALITFFMVRYRAVGLYMIPYAIMPILLKTFFEARIALFVYLIAMMLIGFIVPNSFEFLFLHMTAGIVAIMSLSNVYRRNKMFLTSVWVIAAYFSVYTGISLYQEGNVSNLNIDNLFYFAGNGLLIMSALPLIYIFERLFGFLSDATLLELSDTNQPLLRMLAEKAPGTFQHSLQVANLAEEAVYRIGGNPLLVRAGALYHDIGKMENPAYFIENLSDQSNPHEKLSFEESAKIIIAHVEKGVELALKYHLPEAIIHFIRTHHGTTMAHYFYHAYIRMHPDAEINPEKFTYPGPKPFSREMAVIMLADSIEAASRSLKKYSEKDIHSLVDTIVDNLMKDKQLNDTNLTLKDIETIRNTFKRRLMNIYHTRIEYPGVGIRAT